MKNKYDVIIIGAGIGGLVCGCYLSKAGKKVLILEKMNKPGGYCSSFERNGFLFDAGPHSFGSCRPYGQIGKLIRNLNLESKIIFKRKRLSNIIMTPEHRIYFDENISNTIYSLQKIFATESENIKLFFDLILNKNIAYLYSKVAKKNFQTVMDSFFNNYKLKSVLGMLLGNLGLSPYQASAFTAAILYREHIFDGGYYPEGGMQIFSNVLAKKFEELGGVIFVLSEVDKMILKNKQIKEITTKNGKTFKSNYVVSNCDSFYTYAKLIGESHLDPNFIKNIGSLKTSPSFYVVHLGLKKKIKNDLVKCSTLWYFPTYDIESIHKKAEIGEVELNSKYLVFGFPYLQQESETNVMTLLNLSPYKNADYWKYNKSSLSAHLVNQAMKILPDLLDNIDTICTSTPYDFYRYTYNKNGSISGWASTVSQTNCNIIGIKSYIKNLFHTGHWITSSGGQGGIPMVVYSGKMSAKTLLAM